MKVMQNFRYVLIVLAICFSTGAYAQGPSFTASLSQASVGVNEQFQITFSLNAEGKNFQAPSMKDFYVISGPSQSSSMQFINGNMSQSISYSYILQPKNEGTFKIGSASIESNGKLLKSNAVSIAVAKNNATGSAGGEENLTKQIEDNVYIKVIVSKTNVMRGEAIKVTYKLFTKIDMLNFNLTKAPTLNGFWSHEVNMSKQLELKTEVIEGVRFNTAELKKTVLFPQREGNLELDVMEAETVVRVRTNKRRQQRGNDPFQDLFDDPFFGGGYGYQDMKFVLKSKPVKITVNPLPANAPASFSGAVGEFSMESFIDKPETKANEPVTLKVKISGTGNLKLLDPIQLQLPKDIETYDPKIADNISANQNGVSGSRSFEYLLIPRHSGQYKVKPFEFSYYSLEKKKYISLSSPEFMLKVDKGNENEKSAVGATGLNKEDVQMLGKDIHFIKTNAPEFLEKENYLFGTGLFYSLFGAQVLCFIAFIFYRKKQEEGQANVAGTKSRKALKLARQRLTKAQKFLAEKDNDKVYDEILKSLWSYASDKFSISAAELSAQNIEQVLISNGKDKQLVDAFMDIIHKCEFARYAPAGASHQAEEVYKAAIDMIARLEQG